MQIWLVIPCFNEAERLDVAAFTKSLNSMPQLHLIMVNDGSHDGTLAVLEGLARSFPGRVEVIDQQPNRGKSEAVRVGMLRAMQKDGAYAGYFDADLATPLEEAATFASVLDSDPDTELVLGARVALLGRRIKRKATRHYLGRAFATSASLVLGLPVYDTQCGAKLLRVNKATRALFEEPFGSRWIFDVELIARYLHGGGSEHGLFEVPVRRWTDVGDSRVRGSDFLRAIGELARIFQRYSEHERASRGFALVASPFVRYLGAGGIGTLLHYATLLLVVETLSVRASVASALGATIGALTNYVLNYHLTFASSSAHLRTFPRFLCVALLSVILTGAGVSFASERLGLHYLVAQLVCTVLVLGMGYVVNRAWTFAVGPSLSTGSELPPKVPGP